MHIPRPDASDGYPGRTYKFYNGKIPPVYSFGDGLTYEPFSVTMDDAIPAAGSKGEHHHTQLQQQKSSRSDGNGTDCSELSSTAANVLYNYLRRAQSDGEAGVGAGAGTRAAALGVDRGYVSPCTHLMLRPPSEVQY